MKIKVLNNKKNKIKLPKKRIQFERFLLKMGIRDRSVIIIPMVIKQKILCDTYPNVNIYQSMKLYVNIKSYVYEYFKDKNTSKEKVLKLYNRLKINNKNGKGRVAEQIWSMTGSEKIRLLDRELSKKILYSFIKHVRAQISVGVCGEIADKCPPIVLKVLGTEKIICIPPKPYDILVSKPSGQGILLGFSILQVRKKSLISRRVGFGKLDEDLHQYVFYDENLKLNTIHPI
jgi:hypothetical protein